MDNTPVKLPAPETLFAAAVYLATNYVKTGCPMLCQMVMRQLACIQNHPSASVSQDVRDTCSKLREEWERIGCERAQLLQEAAVTRRADGVPLH